MGKTELDITHVNAARERISAFVHQTPVLTSSTLNELCGASLYFKCENLQRTGSFKYRGATNAIQSLDSEVAGGGVATHSSGNHGAAVSLAARKRDIPAHIVVPKGAVRTKVESIARYGGIIHFCDNTLAARDSLLNEVVQETGAHVVHPFEDVRIMAGQGTAALELVQAQPDLDVLVTPVGGGGLISGTAAVAAGMRSAESRDIQVIGAEPAGADDAAKSLSRGSIAVEVTPDTICDGLRATIGEQTFAQIKRGVNRILLASDDQTVEAMRHLWHRMKMVVEPSSAVTLAAILAHPDEFAGRHVGVVLSGGNVDLDQIPW